MTAPAQRRRSGKKKPSRRRRIPLAVLAAGAAILAIGMGVYLSFGTSWPEFSSSVAVAEPPSLDRVTDPAVKRLLTECRAAVVQAPRSAAAWGRLGMAFYIHDFPDEAKVSLAAAEQLDPRDPRWHYFEGLLRMEADPDEAIQQLQRAADLCRDNPDTPRLQLAEVLLAHGRADKAVEQFQQVLRRDPKNARAHLGLGRLALRKGNLSQAQTHLDFCVRDRHTQKAAHLLLAQIQQRSGNQAAAEQEDRQGARAPDDLAWPDPYLDEASKLQTGMKTFLIRANLLLEQHRLDACIALCRELLRDYPDSDTLWLTLGKAFVQKKDLPAAQQALEKVLQLRPDSVQAYFQLGFASYLGGDYPAAVRWYRKATELKPDFTFAYHDLGHCLLKLGDEAAAIEAFRAALRCQPDLTGVHKTLAELLMKEGQHGEAFRHACVALQLNPADATAKRLVQGLLARLALPAGL